MAANALLYAAEHPTRDLYVGGRAKLLGTAAHYMPSLVDKGMKRFVYRYTKTDRPPRSSHDNNLYTPKSDLLERGGVGGRAHETSLYTSAVTHPVATKALMLSTGLALVAMWQTRRHRPAS